MNAGGGYSSGQAMNDRDYSVTQAAPIRWFQRVLDVLRSIRVARRTRSLHLRETLALGERRQILLVEWDTRRYLIGATPQGITVLDSVNGTAIDSATDVKANANHRVARGGGR